MEQQLLSLTALILCFAHTQHVANTMLQHMQIEWFGNKICCSGLEGLCDGAWIIASGDEDNWRLRAIGQFLNLGTGCEPIHAR